MKKKTSKDYSSTIKTISGLYEYLKRFKTRRLGIPLEAELLITERCNFRCLHCYQLHSSSRKEMSYHEICSVIDQLADMGTLCLTISGGEPLVRQEFWKIMEYARKREFIITLRTNGSLITKDVAQRLADLFIQDVLISLYGVSEHTYQSATGNPGAFKSVVRALELLKEKGIQFRITATIMRENFLQLKAFEKFGKRMGFNIHFDALIIPSNNGCQKPLRHRLTRSEANEFHCLHPEKCKPFLNSRPSSDALLCEFGGRDVVAINPFGDVLPCLLIENNANIREKSITKILKEDSLFRRVRSYHWGQIPPQCMDCKAILYCKPCPGMFFQYTGKLISSPAKKMCEWPWLMKKAHEGRQIK